MKEWKGEGKLKTLVSFYSVACICVLGVSSALWSSRKTFLFHITKRNEVVDLIDDVD